MKEIIIILPLQMFNMLLEMYNLSAIYQINPNLDKLDIFLTHLLDQWMILDRITVQIWVQTLFRAEQ